MPTCAMHPSQPSQFDSQPLSQHALSQTSELSFGGGAALHGASMTALHSAKADAASSMNGSSSHDNDLNASERQEDPDDDDDGDDSQASLKIDEAMEKLAKMLHLRGNSVQADLLVTMNDWLRELFQEDSDRASQEKSVAIVEDFIRQSSIRTAADLMQIDVKDRQWWPEVTEGVVDPKKVDMSCLTSYGRPNVVLIDMLKAKQAKTQDPDTCADNTKTGTSKAQSSLKNISTPVGSPIMTQIVAETPEASLDAASTRPLPFSGRSPQRAASCQGDSGDSKSIEQSPACATVGKDDATIHLHRHPTDATIHPHLHPTSLAIPSVTVCPIVGPGSPPKGGVAASERFTLVQGAGASSGDKRPRDDDTETAYMQTDALDEKVEKHRSSAEHSFKLYHDLLAKRARLTREVDCAKQLEMTKREIVCKVEKDKSTLSARDEELDAANNALEEAQKRVWAAQKAKRQQAFAAQAHEAELNEIMREQKECNGRLKLLTEEFHILLAKNNKGN